MKIIFFFIVNFFIVVSSPIFNFKNRITSMKLEHNYWTFGFVSRKKMKINTFAFSFNFLDFPEKIYVPTFLTSVLKFSASKISGWTLCICKNICNKIVQNLIHFITKLFHVSFSIQFCRKLHRNLLLKFL